ncbi:hypothetical protein EU528_07430 [Candidatus Thorarchaeota archaeon]|nr:MAG: hypothetical protein EU528_07430 [Candidatus Thorarchaeota archaeon]
MGDLKDIKKFQRLLAECEESHIYQGKIADFVKVDYVPKERYATGMMVTSKNGTHRVEFASGEKKYIENASSFRIGDEIIVLGKENPTRSNTTIPSIILIPDEETVVLSKEHLGLKFHGWIDYAQVLFYILGSILGVLSLFGDLIFSMLYGEFYFNRPLVYWSGFGAILFVVALLSLDSYSRHMYRAKEILCDPETWKIINNMLASHVPNFHTS